LNKSIIIVAIVMSAWSAAGADTYPPGFFEVPAGALELRLTYQTTTGATDYYPEENWSTDCGWCYYFCDPPEYFGSHPGVPSIPPTSDWSVSILGPASSVFGDSGTVSNTLIAYANPCESGRGGVGVPPGPDVSGTTVTHRETINIAGLTTSGPATFELRAEGATASVKVITKTGRVYVDVDDSFNPSNPQDDYKKFVPGALLDGRSVEHGIMAAGGQRIKLHVLTAPALSGTIELSIGGVTRYPGVAMNYPIPSPSTSPSTLSDYSFVDNASQEHLMTTVPINSTGHTVVTLFVRDYAAKGRLRVKITSGDVTETIFNQLLPQDDDGNGMPDAGWRALGNAGTGATNRVDDVYAPDSDDDNDPVVTGVPAQGITGDGLSAAEEYRGFVVRNKHRRLHPLRKDLFVLIDPVDDGIDDRITELPLAVHEIRRHNAVGDDSPVVNPNRATVPGASLQRALRVRNRFISPQMRLIGGGIVDADHSFLGYTFQIGDNKMLIDESTAALGLVQSPNEVMAAEVFDQAFTRHYISYGADQILSTSVAPTDIDNPEHLVIEGGNDRLQSFTSGDDHLTTVLGTVCGSGDPDRPWRALTTEELLDLYANTFLHEAAHGLDVEHDRVNCSPSIMSDEAALPVIRPLTANDQAQIRIHRKH
jgi:hypothetical protein